MDNILEMRHITKDFSGVKALDDVNLVVKREVFEAVGGYDSHYWPGEDTKLCLDITHKAGKKIGEFVDEFKKESEEDDGDVVEVVKDAAEDVADTAEDVAEKVSDAVSEVAETVGDETEDFFNDDDET